MNLNDLTPEQQEKARACKSEEELRELAKSIGIELSEDELSELAGGVLSDICRKDRPCPNYMVPGPCPSETDCMKLSCSELSPCSDLLNCNQLKGPQPCDSFLFPAAT